MSKHQKPPTKMEAKNHLYVLIYPSLELFCLLGKEDMSILPSAPSKAGKKDFLYISELRKYISSDNPFNKNKKLCLEWYLSNSLTEREQYMLLSFLVRKCNLTITIAIILEYIFLPIYNFSSATILIYLVSYM